MFNYQTTNSQIVLLEPITLKVLYSEIAAAANPQTPFGGYGNPGGIPNMAQQPMFNTLSVNPMMHSATFVTVDVQKYMEFVANAQTTAAASLAALAKKRQQLMDLTQDKDMLKQVIEYLDYGIGVGYLTTPATSPQRAKLCDELNKIQIDMHTAMQPVQVHDVVKRVSMVNKHQAVDTTVEITFVDHTGTTLALQGLPANPPMMGVRGCSKSDFQSTFRTNQGDEGKSPL